MILNEKKKIKEDSENVQDCLRMTRTLRYFRILRILNMIIKERKK